jgi:hypothetical protein
MIFRQLSRYKDPFSTTLVYPGFDDGEVTVEISRPGAKLRLELDPAGEIIDVRLSCYYPRQFTRFTGRPVGFKMRLIAEILYGIPRDQLRYDLFPLYSLCTDVNGELTAESGLPPVEVQSYIPLFF